VDEVTRPPQKEDLVKLCEELNRLGARYIVIGGLAMNNLGLVRTTEDVDLLVDPSPENQCIVREALLILPDQAIRELAADEDLQEWIVTRVNDEIIVDLMKEACNVGYEEAKADVQIREVQSVPIPLANRRLILMIKLKQGRRPKTRSLKPTCIRPTRIKDLDPGGESSVVDDLPLRRNGWQIDRGRIGAVS
jgi:hypothetical protein